jgi:hypothetical protein
MSRSLTLSVPSARQVSMVLATVLGALALLLVGARIGASLLAPSPVMSVTAGGELHQIQLLGGSAYLGRILSDEGGMLRVGDAALLRQQQAPTASGNQAETQLIVQSLTTDPFGITSDVVIPIDQVALIGVVDPDSSLGAAYGEAMGTRRVPSGTPSP